MTYLLDTDILSELLRRVPQSALRRRIAGMSPFDQTIPSMSVGELVYGAQRVEDPRRTWLLGQIEDLLLANFTVVPFDSRAAIVYGELRADLERRGTPIGDADTRIASIALANDLVVVTGNTRRFERVPGLEVENWLVE